ncbi:ribonuclease HI family protein [Candidatus Bathyarchaeota archaeon]|nr:ribonuclease HI family protein [Candidatus Bathyarchaeota archaeon]
MLRVFIDGSVEPTNPGGVGAVGIVVYKDGMRILRMGKVVGEGPTMSNNRAEYEALKEVLQWLLDQDLSVESISVNSDSSLLVYQMQGRWKVKGGIFLTAHNESKQLAKQFRDLSFHWVPREENEEADLLARNAYKEYKEGDP